MKSKQTESRMKRINAWKKYIKYWSHYNGYDREIARGVIVKRVEVFETRQKKENYIAI